MLYYHVHKRGNDAMEIWSALMIEESDCPRRFVSGVTTVPAAHSVFSFNIAPIVWIPFCGPSRARYR